MNCSFWTKLWKAYKSSYIAIILFKLRRSENITHCEWLTIEASQFMDEKHSSKWVEFMVLNLNIGVNLNTACMTWSCKKSCYLKSKPSYLLYVCTYEYD
jgi:hypothetical protein